MTAWAASFQRAVPASSSAAPCRSYVYLHGLPRCLPAKFWAYSLVIEELWKPPISFHGLAIQTWWFSIYVKLPKAISRICLTWYLAYTWQIQNDISTVRYSSNLRRNSLDVDIRTDLGIPASESSPESLANHSFSMLLICLNDFVLLTKLFHPQTDHGLAQIPVATSFASTNTSFQSHPRISNVRGYTTYKTCARPVLDPYLFVYLSNLI